MSRPLSVFSRASESSSQRMDDSLDGPIEIPITGELDLHTFRAQDAIDAMAAYFEACLEKKILTVRVVHGKGTGALREKVHRYLRTSALVHSFGLADAREGGWGATWVKLLPPD